MLDWQAIDSVFLDMDGTLLDLHFDNHFWLEQLPRKLAEHRRVPLQEAMQEVMSLAQTHRGQLNWYCTDFWSEALNIDIPALKLETAHLIRYRPEAEAFLKQVRASGRRLVLVTNAHPQVLQLKGARTGLDQWFDRLLSAHTLGHAKESAAFWSTLQEVEPHDPERSLMIDDSLPVLRAARAAGIAWLLGIRQPDSRQPGLEDSDFTLLEDFGEIFPPRAAGMPQA